MHTIGLPRTCLGFTNVLFFFFGLIGVVICVWCAVNTEFFRDVNYTVTKSQLVHTVANFVNLKVWLTPLTTILIPFALVAMLTSCCGILGAGCQTKCAIKAYVFLVTIVSSIVFWFVFITCIYNVYSNNEKTRRSLQSVLLAQYGKEKDLFTHFWNYFMVNYECCGVDGFSDFKESQWTKENPGKLFPVQCCKLQNLTHLIPVLKDCQTQKVPNPESFHVVGCFDALRLTLRARKGTLITYIALLMVAYFVLVSFACIILRGEPLVRLPSDEGFKFVPQRPNLTTTQMPSETSLENMMFSEEPPKKVMRVVSAANPFQTYKFTPHDYRSQIN